MDPQKLAEMMARLEKDEEELVETIAQRSTTARAKWTAKQTQIYEQLSKMLVGEISLADLKNSATGPGS